MTPKGILITCMLLLSIAVGSSFDYLLVGMMLSFPGFGGESSGGWISFSNPAEFIRLTIIFVILMMAFGAGLYSLRKVMGGYVMLCVLLFILSIVFTPIASYYINTYKDYPKAPGSKAQAQATQDIKTTILKTNLPYKMDLTESEKLTRMNKRITNVVLRTVKGNILKEEIDTFIKHANFNELYSNFYLIVYSQDKRERIALIINKDSIVSYCSPLEQCLTIS